MQSISNSLRFVYMFRTAYMSPLAFVPWLYNTMTSTFSSPSPCVNGFSLLVEITVSLTFGSGSWSAMYFTNSPCWKRAVDSAYIWSVISTYGPSVRPLPGK